MDIDNSQKIKALPHIRYEIEMLLNPVNYDSPDNVFLGIIRFRKLAAARSLYYFFTTPKNKRKHDDILCEDFDYPHEELKEEKKQLFEKEFNKRLFHLTYARTEVSGGWRDKEIVELISEWSRSFARWMVENLLEGKGSEKSSWERINSNEGYVHVIDEQDSQNISSEPPSGINT